MAKYKVMCVRYGFTEVEADSESEAIDIAEGNLDFVPLEIKSQRTKRTGESTSALGVTDNGQVHGVEQSTSPRVFL